jgi:predicted transcriptional regulator
MDPTLQLSLKKLVGKDQQKKGQADERTSFGNVISDLGTIRPEKNRASRNLEEPVHYTDIIEHSVNPFKSKSSKIAEMSIKDGLSASQVAEKLGISRTAVLEKLHALGIRNEALKGERMTNPNNYRAAVAPYGYRKVDGQLVANKKELRICRLVVRLINEQELSLNGTARDLMQKNIKNGNVWWDHSMVVSIYKRWNGKL